MNSFRWLFGIVTVVLLGGWIFLVVVAGNFRRSFGASPTAPFLALLPGLIMVLMLGSLLWPAQRPLLHITAAAAVLGLVASIIVLRESATTGILGAGYLVCWLVFYWLTIRSPYAHG